MKKPDITKGNWQHWEDEKIVQSDLDNETLICEVNYTGTDPEEESANAKAISAVPDMIDALIDIHSTYRNNETGNMVINKSKWYKIKQALEKAGATP